MIDSYAVIIKFLVGMEPKLIFARKHVMKKKLVLHALFTQSVLTYIKSILIAFQLIITKPYDYDGKLHFFHYNFHRIQV